MKSKLIMLVLGILIGTQVMAQGREGGVGNGGCPACQESFKYSLDIAKDLLVKGQAKMDEVAPLINVKEYYQTALKRKVAPARAENMDGRTAISYSAEALTKIDVEAYIALSKQQKLLLEIHEVLVLMGVEFDGVYVWSTELVKMFPDYGKLEGSTYSCNKDVCEITYPKVGESYISFIEVEAVCRYFNLGTLFYRKKERTTASSVIFNSFGHITDTKRAGKNDSRDIISMLRCATK